MKKPPGPVTTPDSVSSDPLASDGDAPAEQLAAKKIRTQASEPTAAGPAGKPPPAANDRRQMLGLMLGALGVVFGDIGTSPLYALKATVLATEGGLPNHVAVMGSLSMIF